MKESSLRIVLSKELELLDKDPNRNSTDFEIYKVKVEAIESQKCKGAVVRSRMQNIIEGEKCTAFFFFLRFRERTTE